jgi:hypothetical protein
MHGRAMDNDAALVIADDAHTLAFEQDQRT